MRLGDSVRIIRAALVVATCPDSKFRALNLDVVCWFYEPANGSEFLLVDYEAPVARDGLMNANGRLAYHRPPL